jgi:hypothetical protein
MLTVAPAPDVMIRYVKVPDGIDPASLFGVARRINPRRSALFVSRVLGKHVPVDPAICVFAGLHLASQIRPGSATPSTLSEGLADPAAARSALGAALGGTTAGGPPLHIIGFAETATALGHAVRDGLPGADYVHTTRRSEVGWEPVVTFDEEHSHAVHHRIVHRDPAYLNDDHPVLFVDDELTTGRTILNAIRSIQQLWPRSHYLVACYLDWRDPGAVAAFREAETRLDTTITVSCLVAGRASWVEDGDGPVADVDVADGVDPATVPTVRHRIDLGHGTARHGWDSGDQKELEALVGGAAQQLAGARHGPRTLVLGTEEYMYAPLRLALAMGDGVVYQSTTRSPIVVADVDGYPIRHKVVFRNPAEPHLLSFLYNVAPGAYDDIIVVFEEDHNEAVVASLQRALAAARPLALHLAFAGA